MSHPCSDPPCPRRAARRPRLPRLPVLLALAVVAATAVGCGQSTKVARYNYRVALTESMRDPATGFVPSIEIDVVGVNDVEKPEWDALDVDAYFAPGNPRRADGDRVLLAFSNEAPEPRVLDEKRAIWDVWEERGATHVFLLARMRRPADAGSEDPRKLVLPLSAEFWNPGQWIEIAVTPTGLELRSAPATVRR